MTDQAKTWTCCGREWGYDREDVYAFCPFCGKPRPAPALTMSEDERLAWELNEEYRRAGGDDLPEAWENYSKRLQGAALAGLAKARALLTRPLPSVEEIADALDKASHGGQALHSWHEVATVVRSILASPAPAGLPAIGETTGKDGGR